MTDGQLRKNESWGYETANFHSVEDVIEFAIKREVQAQEFYDKLARIIKDEKLRKIINDLQTEEIHHELVLYKIKHGQQKFNEDEVSNINIVEYSPNYEPWPDMNRADLLLLCIKKEETSRRLYTHLAAICKDPEMRETIIRLAQEEARHKLRFEVEYDLLTY